MNKLDDKLFEQALEQAFNEQYNEELMTEPTMDELNRLYPVSAKQIKEAKRLSKEKRKPVWTKFLGRAAAVILCFSISGFGLIMIDPDIRATVGDSIVKYIEDGFNIDFTESTDNESIDIPETSIGYIPEGFELLEDRTEEGTDSLSYSYMNRNGEYIVIDILSSSDIELVSENEHHDLKLHHIGEYTGYIAYSETQRQGSVYFGNSRFTVAISGMTSRDELIKIAENIEIKE